MPGRDVRGVAAAFEHKVRQCLQEREGGARHAVHKRDRQACHEREPRADVECHDCLETAVECAAKVDEATADIVDRSQGVVFLLWRILILKSQAH